MVGRFLISLNTARDQKVDSARQITSFQDNLVWLIDPQGHCVKYLLLNFLRSTAEAHLLREA